MAAPGYYKTNYRALRLGEMIRWYGFSRGLKNYLVTRRMRPTTTGSWMPGLWAESECKPEELSERFWQATKPHRKDFEDLGFTQCRLSKSKSLSPLHRDAGGVNYLDSTRRFFGILLFIRIRNAATGVEKNEIIIAFTAVFENGSFTCTNARKTYEPPTDAEVIRLNTYKAREIYERFVEALQQRKETPHEFRNVEALRQWFDARQIRIFEDRVRRGLFIRMTDAEVAAAQARLHGPPPLPKTKARPALGLRPAVWLLIIGCIVILQFLRCSTPSGYIHGRADTIEYRGSEFKTRKAYPSYEDYKDDPNNLDTNELARIEQVMTNAPVPAHFANVQELGHFMIFELKFPGYGEGGIGEEVNTDDGSKWLVQFVEIPQRDKERILTFRQSGQAYDLIDDFICSTADGGVRRVVLEKQVLRYYDGRSQLLREKALPARTP